jgi:hypothetical protein
VVDGDGFFLDENVSGRLGQALRDFGHDVLTTAASGRKGASDVDQLSFAARTNRILVTLDTGHFELLHEAWHRWSHDWGVAAERRHAGILLLPDSGILAIAVAARAIEDLLQLRADLRRRLFVLSRRAAWRELVL